MDKHNPRKKVSPSRKVENQEGRLDVQQLHRDGALERNARRAWSTCLEGKRVDVIIRSYGDHIVLECSNEVYLNKTIFLKWTPCHFGGQRPWFNCSACHEKVGILFYNRKNRGFACRRCLKLVYDSQLDGTTMQKYLKAQKLVKQLGLKELPRLKGMHQTTYQVILRK